MEDIATSVWIDPSWLSWRRYVEGGHYLFDGAPARPHEIHQHACDRLASDPNSFDRTDAIMHLRRAVGQRVQMLMKNYQLRRVQISMKPERDLELLSYFGIIRPFMLRQLIKIRNLVEHEDSIPPSTDECLMFADLVWYFLRSTDALVNLRSEEIEFVGPGGDIYDDYTPSVNLSFKEPLNEPPTILVRIEMDCFANEPIADWIKIDATEIDEYQQLTYGGDEGKEEDWIPWVKVWGKVNGTDEQMRLIYQQYFNPLTFERPNQF